MNARRPRTSALAAFMAVAAFVAACNETGAAPPAVPTASSGLPAAAPTVAPPAARPPASAPSSGRPCELGVWDVAANTCAIPPGDATGYPGGWAGCSHAAEPQSGRCFTGTHWAAPEACECACNGKTKWNDAKRRCE